MAVPQKGLPVARASVFGVVVGGLLETFEGFAANAGQFFVHHAMFPCPPLGIHGTKS